MATDVLTVFNAANRSCIYIIIAKKLKVFIVQFKFIYNERALFCFFNLIKPKVF